MTAPMTETGFEAASNSFPSLSRWVYMVMASQGCCPAGTFEDLASYEATLRNRPFGLAEWIERVEEMHGLIEQLLGAPPNSVALFDSATACHAATLAAVPPPGRRNRILVSEAHFPSIRYLAQAQTRRGFAVETIAPRPDGSLRADDLLTTMDDRVAAVLAPVVAPFSGALLDFPRLAEGAAEAGAVALLDAYAAVGIVPIDVSRLAPCVVVGGTLKWLCGGGTGACFMSIHPALLEQLQPAYPGWMADANFLAFRPHHVPAPGARRFQQGTPAIEPIYTARAGLRFVLEHGPAALRARNLRQLDAMLTRARELDLRTRSPHALEQLAGFIALEVADPPAVVATLRERGIAIDTREPSTVRLGPHPCISMAACTGVIDAIAEIEAS